MVRMCHIFCVEFRGASCRLRPRDSGGEGTGTVRACVRWPYKIVNAFFKVSKLEATGTFALQMSSERDDPAQLRTSVANRLGSGCS
jgi:hypothetical protein